MSISTATAVIGFVMDASRKSVSARIGLFASKSVVPNAAKCTTLPLRATKVRARQVLCGDMALDEWFDSSQPF
jgi:hypothetical protein